MCVGNITSALEPSVAVDPSQPQSPLENVNKS